MFCPKCKSIMMPKKEKDKTVLACNCGYSQEAESTGLKETKKRDEKPIEIASEEKEILPLTDAECPKCGHKKAYFWTRQMRAMDEPETRFYKCEKCKHTWREYK